MHMILQLSYQYKRSFNTVLQILGVLVVSLRPSFAASVDFLGSEASVDVRVDLRYRTMSLLTKSFKPVSPFFVNRSKINLVSAKERVSLALS